VEETAGVLAAVVVVEPSFTALAACATVAPLFVAEATAPSLLFCSPMAAQPPTLAPRATRVSPIFMPIVFTTGRFCCLYVAILFTCLVDPQGICLTSSSIRVPYSEDVRK
jgi:hypothetical protein